MSREFVDRTRTSLRPSCHGANRSGPASRLRRSGLFDRQLVVGDCHRKWFDRDGLPQPRWQGDRGVGRDHGIGRNQGLLELLLPRANGQARDTLMIPTKLARRQIGRLHLGPRVPRPLGQGSHFVLGG